MDSHYHPLCAEERACIMQMTHQELSLRHIAAVLRRAPSSISREIRRNTIAVATVPYDAAAGLQTRQRLRQGHDGRRKRSQGEDRRGRLPDMVSIHECPPEVEGRLVPGHWEADLIKGAGNRSAVATLVERTSRLVMLAKMPDASAASALAALTAMLNRIPEPSLRQTLTYDQGREMSRHKELTERTGVRVYFADPPAPGSAAAMKTPMA